MSIWRYADRFTDVPPEHFITLGEGDTPLVRSKRIGPEAGLENLCFKLETANPTGSYKDRFAAAAIASMLAQGQSRCYATSSGNAGSALAAYCAAAGIACEIATIESAPRDKIKQMMVYGANVYLIRGFGIDSNITRDAFDFVRAKGDQPGAAMHISAFVYSPVGMAGVQTISYELQEQLVRVNDVFVPGGGCGLMLGIARGFENRPTRVHIVQPEGNDTIATAVREGEDKARVCECTSEIGGLQVPVSPDGDEALSACRASGGTGYAVADQEVWGVQKRLAREEGIFCEPAGAVALAGALKALKCGELDPTAAVVCIVTGVGFKDAPAVDRMLADLECPAYDLAELKSAGG